MIKTVLDFELNLAFFKKFVVVNAGLSKNTAEFKNSDKKYFNLINSILDVVVELGLDFTAEYINPQVYDIFGYSSEEIIGNRSIDFIHPDDISKILKAIKKTIKLGEIMSEELRVKHKNGQYIPVSAKGRMVEYNNQTKIVAIFRDITEIKEAQQKIKESEKKFREKIENLEDGYFEVDLKGNYTYVNDYYCHYLGISKEELLGKSYKSVLDGDTISEVYKEFNNIFKINLPKGIFESQVIRNDGEKRCIEGSFYLKYDSDGRRVGFYGFTRDITNKKIIEAELKKSKENYHKAYEQARFYKDLFIHDINNIFSNVKSSIELGSLSLNDPEKLDDAKKFCGIVKEQIVRGEKLVSNILKLSQYEESKVFLKPIDAKVLLNTVINFIYNSYPTKNIEISTESVNKEIYIQANDLLMDVFENLLLNAVRYNKNETVELIIKISKINKDNLVYIKFEFIDNGIGISDARKKIIFEEGYNKTKSSKGMGIGLSLVKRIITTYNGQIWVEDRIKNDYSKGSNFILLIPEAI